MLPDSPIFAAAHWLLHCFCEAQGGIDIASKIIRFQGEVGKHYSSSRTKCGATQTSKHIELQSQLPQFCRCDTEAHVHVFYVRFSRTIEVELFNEIVFSAWGPYVCAGFASCFQAGMFSKISHTLCVIRSFGPGPPSQTHGSQWGLTCYSTHCSCCWRGLCQWWLGFRQFSARRRLHHFVPRDAMCLCLTAQVERAEAWWLLSKTNLSSRRVEAIAPVLHAAT